MAIDNSTQLSPDSNPTQDIEHLKRKFLQAWKLRDKLEAQRGYCKLKIRAYGDVYYRSRLIRVINRLECVDDYIDRLTAPAGGAE